MTGPAVSALSMPVVVAPDHVHHDVATGVWCGVTEATDELPVRAEIIATACAAAGAKMIEAADHGRQALQRVHDERFLDVLQSAHQRWVADGRLESPGIPYVTPYSSHRSRDSTAVLASAARDWSSGWRPCPIAPHWR